jgi:hypothetical protein
MYTYAELLDDIAYLGSTEVDVGVIGASAFGNKIPYVHVGVYSGKQIIITGGIHARENITSLLVIKQAFDCAFSKTSFEGGIYFLPMINVDGALLIEKGAEYFGKRAEFLKSINSFDLPDKRSEQAIKHDFSLWKANINGVDLNNNFDARFSLGKGQKHSPSPMGFHGEYPFSEPETNALRRFTLSIAPALTVSYHALGREVYWEFFQSGKQRERDFVIADKVAKHLGYKRVDGDLGSSGGYKDWCIDSLKIPSLTIEIIPDSYSHFLEEESLEEDYQKNRSLPVLLTKIVGEL